MTNQPSGKSEPESAQIDSLKTFFQLSSDLFAEVDFQGAFVRVNPAWTETLGYTLEELIGTRLIEYVHPSDLTKTVALTVSIISGTSDAVNNTGLFENRYKAKNGTYKWLSWSWAIDQRNKLIIAVARDVTDKYDQETRLTDSLKKLQTSNEELQNFASVASHDLREPLRMVTSYLQLLQARYPETIDNRARHYIETACSGADRMRTMIEDLLAYARLSNEPHQLEPIEIDEILGEVIDMLSVSIRREQASVTVDIENAPIVMGDRSRLLRLLQNLLSNALKFHDEETKPVVSIRFPERPPEAPSNHCYIEIHDNGIGIDPDHLALLFNAFQRLNTREEYEGNGIGLAACKKIVEQHGGAISVKSKLNFGSVFRIQLIRPEHL